MLEEHLKKCGQSAMEYQHATAGCSDALGCSGCRLHIQGMELRFTLRADGVLGFHVLRKSNSAEIYGKFE